MSIYDQWRVASPAVKSRQRLDFVQMMRRLLYLIFFSLLWVSPAASAQSVSLERLTPQNLHRLTQVGLIRRGTIEEIAWSPDETRIVVGGSAGLRIYTVESGREQLLLGHHGAVNDVDISPSGREVISVSDDGTLRLWDMQTGLLLQIFNPYADMACDCVFRLTSAKFTADGHAIWVGAANGPLRIIDIESGEVVAEDQRNVLEIVPDADRSRYAVIEPYSSRVTIWAAAGEFVPVREIDVRFTVWNASFISGGRNLIIAGFVGAQLTVVDLNTSEISDTVRGSRVVHAGSLGSLATQAIDWTSSGRRIWLRISSIASGAVQYSAPLATELTDVKFSPGGELVAYSESNGGLRVVRWRYNQVLMNMPPRGTALIGLELTGGGLVATIDTEVGVVQTLTRVNAPAGNLIRLFNLASGREVTSISTIPYGLISADVLYWNAEFGRLIAASTLEPDVQLEIEPDTWSVRVVDSYLVPLLADRMFFDEHPDGLLIAEGPTTDDVRVYEVANFDNRAILRDAGPNVRFSDDGLMLLTSGPAGVIQIWGVPATTPSAH
jgi:WD40 repeat protein